MKIVPESAIKFYVFETAKTVLAQFTGVEDKNAIPVGARFVAGGVAGLCSQFCIYPVETLKTRIMSTKVGDQLQKSAHQPRFFVWHTAREMLRTQGIRAFWPGLTLGLLGVFPYQALDMGKSRERVCVRSYLKFSVAVTMLEFRYLRDPQGDILEIHESS